MNQLAKDIMKWQKRSSKRHEDGVFIVEGIKMFREIPAERLKHIVVSDSFAKQNQKEVRDAEKTAKTVPGCTFEIVSDDQYARISDTKTPQGVLAVVESYRYRAEDLLKEENGLFILLENLQDPGNLGTILRSSEAAGVTGIIMNRECVDIYNPKVIRATMGSLFRMRFAIVDDLKPVLHAIRERGGKSYAAHLKGAVDYDLPDYKATTAFMIGNESQGLSDALSEAADGYIKIPMQGKVESLNAAMAATILMYEAARQRKS